MAGHHVEQVAGNTAAAVRVGRIFAIQSGKVPQ